MAMRLPMVFISLFLLAAQGAGCARLALRFSPELIDNLAQSLFEECDPAVAKSAMPAELKILEGFLRTDPGNRRILATLSMGYAGYALLFVEEEDPERASRLYLRARQYGLRAMGGKAGALAEAGHSKETVQRLLSDVGPKNAEALLWTAMAWTLWIHHNLDKPAALAQLTTVQACVDRMLEIQPDAFYGVPYVLKGTVLAAQPTLLGGDLKGAKTYFDRALASTAGRFFLASYYCARYYAVAAQDRQLFVSLLTGVKDGSPEDLKGVCLINAVMKRKAAALLAAADDLFI